MALAMPMPVLNEADYQRYRVPDELCGFGALHTAAGGLPLQEMQLHGRIVGLSAQLKLRQRFYNAYSQPLEATYIFPLPGRFAVSSFVMTTQQRRVVGRLEERGEARRQYQEAIAQGKQAALAEEERSEVFTMTVGNIPAYEWVEVELELDGPLGWSDGEAMFRFPLVVAPRYIPGIPYRDSVGTGTQSDTQAVPDASRISPPVLLPGYPNPVRLEIDLSVDPAGLAFALPQVSVGDLLCRQEASGFRLTLQPTCNRLDRDLIVRFPLPSPHLQSSLQVQSQGPNLHYFALHLVPDQLHQLGFQVPRQVVTLLDRSGSMSGWKMVCARRAVGRLVDSLSDQDQFQVLTFDDSVESLDPRRSGLRAGSDRERFLALEQLGKVQERGGTEILRALEAGVRLLAGQPDASLVLVTDGQVGNESEVLRWVQQHARGIRIFTVGIDRAVNASLLQRLAQVTGGHFTLVESEQQLDAAMTGLRQRISPPLLQGVRVLLPGAECSPSEVDLYPGLCSTLLGVCHGAFPSEVELVGFHADGRPFRTGLPVQFTSGVSLEKLWARERVLELEHGFLAGWRDARYEPTEIARFALQHGVLCRFTAFVAVDELSNVRGPLHRVTQAVSQPDGWAAPAPVAVRCGMRPSSFRRSTAGEIAGSKPCLSRSAPSAAPPVLGSCFGPAADPFAACEPSGPPLFDRAAPVAGRRAALPPSPPRDEVQAALEQLRLAATVWALESALRSLRNALVGRGLDLVQLRWLDELLRHVATRPVLSGFQIAEYGRECEQWLAQIGRQAPSGRQDSFWLG